MRRAPGPALRIILTIALLGSGLTAQTPARSLDILPTEGLVASSVTVVRDQAALNAHYYLADETALGLGRRTDAVLARYRDGSGEALLLVAVHPAAEAAERVYARFGRDFFSERFDPKTPRFLERIETGDWAGAARRGPVLVVVLEASDRAACESLLDRAAGNVPAAKSP